MNHTIKIAKFAIESKIRYSLNKKSASKWIRNEISMMGPAVIKLGQFVSTRSNMLDPVLSKELVRLQDDLTPVPIMELQNAFENLPNTWYIEPTPIAVASIGQVHRIKDTKTNKVYIIKVQKPTVAEQIQNDLKILQFIIALLKYIESPKALEFERLFEEFERFLCREIDYNLEMKNMMDFAEIPGFRVPEVYPELCNEQRLVMEYLPTTKINAKEYSARLIEIYVEMLLNYGIIHGDPHPGNFGIDDNGEIVIYDFGNVIRLPKNFTTDVQQIIFAIVQKDADEFIEWLIRLNIIYVSENHPEDKLLLKPFFQSFFNYLEQVDFNKFKSSMITIETPKEIRIDPDFIALIRVFSLLDGTCSRLDPTLNYLDVLAPYTENLFLNIDFLDSRARRDFDKIRRPVNTDDAIISKMNSRVKHLDAHQKKLYIAIALLLGIDASVYSENIVYIFISFLGIIYIKVSKK